VRRARIGIAGEQVLLADRIRHRVGLTQRSAVRVAALMEQSPAGRAGVREGDVIVSLDEQAVTGIDDITRLLDERRIGRKISLGVLRGTRVENVDVVPDERSG
jgi:S1-C subfamily serine protease